MIEQLPAAWDRVVDVNLKGTFLTSRAVLPGMIRRRGGVILNIGSVAGVRMTEAPVHYTASKAALNTYMEGLRIQLRDKGIAVTTICPGFVRTPMTAVNDFHMPWLLEADEALMVGALRRAVDARVALGAVRDTASALKYYLADGGHWRVGLQH